MNKNIINFLIGLFFLSLVLCTVHYSLFYIFFTNVVLYIPIWSIYAFNTVLVVGVFGFIRYKVLRGAKNGYILFLILTLLKMGLALVFLSPLFAGKSDHATTEVINFFIPYFIYLSFEIYSLDKFFKNQ